MSFEETPAWKGKTVAIIRKKLAGSSCVPWITGSIIPAS